MTKSSESLRGNMDTLGKTTFSERQPIALCFRPQIVQSGFEKRAGMRDVCTRRISMKKSLVLLAGASMAFLGLPAVSHAQAASGPFADVPTDHWAYQSVDTLQKAGIVIGYPDGTYGGRRPMTRYEFAVAIARLLAQMNNGRRHCRRPVRPALRPGKPHRRQHGRRLTPSATWSTASSPNWTRLGADVAANTARLDALEARVNALNGRLDRDEGILGSVVDEQRRFKVTGEVNLIARGDASRRTANGSSTATVPFLDENGVYVGGGGAGKRLLASSDIYHDVLLHIRGKIADTTTANVDLDFGNYLSQVGNTAAFGQGGYSAGGGPVSQLTPGNLTANNQYANVYKAYLDAAVKLGPLGGAELLVGRFGNQYTKYTLKQADADIYTNLTQTDSGDVIGDGASLSFKAGPARINGFAFKNTAIQFSELYGGTTSSATTTPFVNVFNPGGTTIAAQSRPGGLIKSDHVARYDEGVGGRVTFGAPEGAVLGATIEQFGLSNAGGGTTSAGVPLGPFDGVTDPNRRGNNAQYNRCQRLGRGLQRRSAVRPARRQKGRLPGGCVLHCQRSRLRNQVQQCRQWFPLSVAGHRGRLRSGRPEHQGRLPVCRAGLLRSRRLGPDRRMDQPDQRARPGRVGEIRLHAQAEPGCRRRVLQGGLRHGQTGNPVSNRRCARMTM